VNKILSLFYRFRPIRLWWWKRKKQFNQGFNNRERLQELIDLETEKTELLLGIKMWISELRAEKTEIVTNRKVLKGQLSSKEINKEEFQEKDDDFDKKLKKMTSKIVTLENLAKIK